MNTDAVTADAKREGAPPVERRTTRVLVGFFKAEDAGSYLKAIGVEAAPDLVSTVQAAAYATVAKIGTRPEAAITLLKESEHLSRLRSEPTFAEHLATQNARFANVEVGKLVACQPRIDWDHVESLMPTVPRVGDENALLEFCLPLQGGASPPKTEAAFNPLTNTFGCVFENPDVRICGPAQGEQPGTGRAVIGFSIGSGLHQMSVISFQGRLMLKNGYHRAVALARAGHERIPVLLGEAPAIGATPPAQAGMFNPAIVFGPRAPRIADFLTSAAADFATRRRRFLFSVHAEVHEIRD